MKFKHGTRRRALEYEKEWVNTWKANKTFEKSVENRPADDSYVFYDGPPFITGVPHHGTLLSSIVKDAVPRYWTMKGKRVERVWGWDTHGLPAENFVEKQLGITDRRQIVTSADAAAPLDKDGNPLETIPLEKYITKARESMVANAATWENVVDRVGRWVDFNGAYKTMDKNYMESVWWAFKELYEKGKIYEGEKVLMFDTKFATPVSKNEVTMDNDAYQTVTDPSLYAKFKLVDTSRDVNIEYFVHGTTTDNQNHKATGWNDGELSELGIEQSVELAKQLADKKFDAIFCSDLERAIKSAELSFPDQTIIHDARLRECNYGDLNGKDSSLVIDEDHIDESYPNGESMRDVEARIRDFCNYLAENYAGKSVAIVAHKVPQFALQVITEGKSWDQVMNDDWRKRGEWQPGWKYAVRGGASVLAWTTTPWTLPANLMLAVNAELTYCEVLVGGEKLIIAEEALERVLQDEKHQPLEHEVLRTFPGSELVGKSYQPLDTGSTWPESDKIHKIYAADFVSHESGTGIVHIAPAYGEDDFELAKSNGVAAFHVIDDNGYYFDTNYKGLEVWENNKRIAKDLMEKGIGWKIEYIRHEYPFNPRSKQRIMYRAIPSWFFDVAGSKPLMLEQNENINWFPAHLKHGRFAKNIEQAPDWNLSRDRFWATAMPVWKGDNGTVKVVGSYEELKELSGVELEDYHRPWVDDITFEIDGEHFTRIDKVLDCWFESGSMPFAQLHYPFENKEKFEANYPADFIVEYVGQVRAWFYYVHTVNTSLADIGAFGADSNRPEKNAYKNVITTGTLAGNDGRKMSKSLGNFTDPNELMDKFSADSLRFLLLSSPLLNGEDFSLQDKDVSDTARKLSMIWNMYDFFTMYAEVDGWEYLDASPAGLFDDSVFKDSDFPSERGKTDRQFAPSASLKTDVVDSRSETDAANAYPETANILESLTNPLDIWIVSRVHQLNREITEYMDEYNLPDALAPILPFLDDASNWFVRRSRRRFWKSEDDNDKNDAYRTLHYVLLKLSVILAPFVPFLAEELYQKLGGAGESVHLLNWPTNYTVDQNVLDEMARTRDLINAGLGLRMKKDEHQESIKVRQPLQFASYAGDKLDDYYEQIIAEELNVKEVRWVENLSAYIEEYDEADKVIDEITWIEVSKKLTPELKREGLSREVVRVVQNARKQAGLNVDDRITLQLSTADDELQRAIQEYQSIIEVECLASMGDTDQNTTQATVDGAELNISLNIR